MTDAPRETAETQGAARRPEMRVRPTAPIVPQANAPRQGIDGLELIPVERLEQAVDYCRSSA